MCRFQGAMAFFILEHNGMRKKVAGSCCAEIMSSIKLKCRELHGVIYSVVYYDKDVDSYIDICDEDLPQHGSTLRLKFPPVLAPETVLDDSQEDSTQFSLASICGYTAGRIVQETQCR